MPSLLSINNYYYRRGGAEVVFLEQNRLFQDIGWRVAPFSMHHSLNDASEWSRYFVSEIEFGNKYSISRKLASALKISYSWESRQNIRKLISHFKPDVAHAHNVYHHISPSFFGVLKEKSIPTVLTLHDLKIACPAYKMLTHDGVCERCKDGAVFNVVLHRCIKDSFTLSSAILFETLVHRVLGCYTNNVDRFVVPSRFYLDKFIEWGWPRERFIHIPNFVDTASLRPSGSPGKWFLFFGRLGPEKGLETFVRAVASAGVAACVVGTGPEEHKLRRLSDELRADITFLGYRTGDDLRKTITDSRAMVLPSEWYENAPMSVMESYAMERPVIGAAIGGIPELIRDGETGALFPSGNVDALAALLRRFAGMHDSAIREMGQVGRGWMEQDFTAECYRDRLINLYRDMGVHA